MPGLRANLRLAVLVVFTAVVNTILNLFIDSSWALIISTLLCAAIGTFFVDIGEESEAE